jgi:hypothetical protein
MRKNTPELSTTNLFGTIFNPPVPKYQLILSQKKLRMKKTILIMAGSVLSLLSLSASAQVPETTMPATSPAPTTWDYKKNPTVDSINAKYKDQLVPAHTAMTTELIFPVLGQYQSSVNVDAPSVKISLDEQNKGIVWIEGLPQGKIKAMLRKSPSTYKIPAQKTEDGKDVAEGTLIFDKDGNALNIVIGRPYNVEDPMSAFTSATEEHIVTETKTKTAKTKVKTKVIVKPWMYLGTKVETTTAMTNQ